LCQIEMEFMTDLPLIERIPMQTIILKNGNSCGWIKSSLYALQPGLIILKERI